MYTTTFLDRERSSCVYTVEALLLKLQRMYHYIFLKE